MGGDTRLHLVALVNQDAVPRNIYGIGEFDQAGRSQFILG